MSLLITYHDNVFWKVVLYRGTVYHYLYEVNKNRLLVVPFDFYVSRVFVHQTVHRIWVMFSTPFQGVL